MWAQVHSASVICLYGELQRFRLRTPLACSAFRVRADCCSCPPPTIRHALFLLSALFTALYQHQKCQPPAIPAGAPIVASHRAAVPTHHCRYRSQRVEITGTILTPRWPIAADSCSPAVLAANALVKRSLFRLPDPFALLNINGQAAHTTCISKKTLNPYWNNTLEV